MTVGWIFLIAGASALAAVTLLARRATISKEPIFRRPFVYWPCVVVHSTIAVALGIVGLLALRHWPR
jgi:hypothetical protein